MTTIHASSSKGAFSKLATYAIQAPQRLPLEATNLLVANAVHFVVFIAQDPAGHRFVSSVREVVDADGAMVASKLIARVEAVAGVGREPRALEAPQVAQPLSRARGGRAITRARVANGPPTCKVCALELLSLRSDGEDRRWKERGAERCASRADFELRSGRPQ